MLSSCNAVKRVEESQHLLTDNTIYVDGEEIKEPEIYSQLSQEPNSSFLGIPIQLYMYNLAKQDADSLYMAWLQRNRS